MRTALSACVLLVACVGRSVCQNSPHPEARRVGFDCHEAARTAKAYLSVHGVGTFEEDEFRIHVSAGGGSDVDRCQGKQITDLKVYWTYANGGTGDKFFFPIWRIRLDHYVAWGQITLTPTGGGCDVEFQLRFLTSGANVLLIIPVDSAWGYDSNGRLEREYLDGISAAAEQRKVPVLNQHRAR